MATAFDMIGNTWEWTSDWWSETPEVAKKKTGGACCTLSNPRGAKLKDSFDPASRR